MEGCCGTDINKIVEERSEFTRKESGEGQKKLQTFEDFLKQNKNRINFHMQQLGIDAIQQQFHMEGMYMLWNARQKYEIDKGALAAYFNYAIRERLMELQREEGD